MIGVYFRKKRRRFARDKTGVIERKTDEKKKRGNTRGCSTGREQSNRVELFDAPFGGASMGREGERNARRGRKVLGENRLL